MKIGDRVDVLSEILFKFGIILILQHMGNYDELMAKVMAQAACLLHMCLQLLILFCLQFKNRVFLQYHLIFRKGAGDQVKQDIEQKNKDKKERDCDQIYFKKTSLVHNAVVIGDEKGGKKQKAGRKQPDEAPDRFLVKVVDKPA